ncbi:MAG: DegT/DnrJ/EryC1/StrS aminotransferase family protein [Pseudomonadota bacterium]
MIPHSKPTIDSEDIKSVCNVLESGAIAQGGVVKEFERSVAAFVGVKGGVAVNSGTAALHLALIALGVKTGDEVILPGYLCVAPLNAVRYVEATPVFSDIDPGTGNIDAKRAQAVVSEKTKAIIVPHMLGQPAQMEGFGDLRIPIIEDCAQSIGARYKGKRVGSFGEVAICSFYATKVITTGEGGMVLSDNKELLETVRDLRDYDEKISYMTRYNYKMTDMQAALGIEQLRKLPEFIAKRRQVAEFYEEMFADLPVRLPGKVDGCEHIFYRYVLRIGSDVEDFIKTMEDLNVVCRRPVYRPLHQLVNQTDLKNTDQVWNDSVSIPIYPMLTDKEREQVAFSVKKVLRG